MNKKITKIILTLILIFGLKKEVYAASASANISVSTTSTVVGNSGTAKLTISSDVPIAQIWGTFSCGGLGKQDLAYSATSSPSTSKTYTINWKANTVGTYTCEVTNLEVGILDGSDTGAWPNVTANSKTIKVVKATSGSSSSSSNKGSSNKGTTSTRKEYSSDNTLKSLNIDGYELTPAFDKNTTEYTLSVDQSIEKIIVSAEANHSKANVAGTGEKSLANGENIIEVKVTAENGNEKVYKLIVNVSDLTPIKVTVDKKELTIVKKNNNLLEPLEHYNEIALDIEEQKIVAYENTKAKVTLVLLKDSEGKIDYYIYDKVKNTYEKYHYIKVGNVTLQLVSNEEKPENYKKYELKLQDEIIDYYKIKDSHKVGLIYGTNVKNGNTGYYIYDANEETLSKYYDEEVKVYKEETKNLKSILMLVVGLVAFATIILIVFSFKKNKKNKINYHKL